MSTSELATSYAALILADDGVEITVGAIFRNKSSDSNHYTGRQDKHPHQIRQSRSRTNMGDSFRKGWINVAWVTLENG